MTAVQSYETRRSGYLERPGSSSLADVIDTILDKGLVIDIFVRVSLVGIELLTIDARIVIASVDTYLRFAEAVDRINLSQSRSRTLPEFVEDVQESGAQTKVKGAAKGAIDSTRETVRELIHNGHRFRDSEGP
jgi:gas vesicle structural protein